jgi:hypothetical protein
VCELSFFLLIFLVTNKTDQLSTLKGFSHSFSPFFFLVANTTDQLLQLKRFASGENYTLESFLMREAQVKFW